MSKPIPRLLRRATRGRCPASSLVRCFLLLLFTMQACQAQLACDGDSYETAACVNEAKYLSFAIPENASAEQVALATDIMALDHRAHEQLTPDSIEWREVIGVLANAANLGVAAGVSAGGQKAYKRAEEAYFRHLEAKHRVTYLLGLLLGILVCTLLGATLYLLARTLKQSFVSPSLLPLLCLFAGMGSLTSVLTRLNTISLQTETGQALLLVSGGTRPVVAIFFAIVVYLVIDLKVLDIKFGSPNDHNANSIYLISSFMCGFSERFAEDILSKIGPAIGA